MPSAERQPPFPQPVIDPNARNPPAKHPVAEAVLNAAAKHVFPESERVVVNDREKGDNQDSGVTREGRPGKKKDETETREEREEDPINAGTPLDEMSPLETPLASMRGTGGFPFSRNVKASTIPEEGDLSGPTAGDEEYRVKTVRPGFGAGKEIGSVRMGASALMSALNALPWEGDEDGESSSGGEDSEDDEQYHPDDDRHSQSISGAPVLRPKISRLHSSLHTIRPSELQSPRDRHHGPTVIEENYSLAFRRPKGDEKDALMSEGKPAIVAELIAGDRRRSSASSDGSMPPGARQMLNDQVTHEQQQGRAEENVEIEKAASGNHGQRDVGEGPRDDNTAAALRESGADGEDLVEDRMSMGAGERQRVRKERLGQKLMDVFALQEREEVLEEMRCWLLRSIMLKGYMYLTANHICFFAHMPDRENVVVKSGPLSKKSSKTKLTSKYWVVLKNDVLSWFESTSDPYFPKGNISLQYVSSCEAIEEHRFKLRTPERNYTFTAETQSARDEWVKAVQKVMFKAQHDGENVKIVIPLGAILEVEKSPTLEFAETVEIRCVDPDDQMSVDSYFFASFADTERTIRKIQRIIDARPDSLLPKISREQSELTLAGGEAEEEEQRQRQKKSHKGVLGGLKKVLKPLVGRHSDHERSSSDVGSTGQRGGSEETLHADENSTVDDGYDGYPPRRSGAPPPAHSEKGWSGWLKKSSVRSHHPNASTSTNLHRASSAKSNQLAPVQSNNSLRDSRPQPGEPERVTEIVEPVAPESGDESDIDRPRGGKIRASYESERSEASGLERSNYAVVDGSEEERLEEGETVRKFRSVFSLPEKEELIDHFPGYLYRVLPVSGRFFVSTNYFCFRSSQLLYKTKMMIPIRAMYGLKAQKAFRFKHSGLIVVIKGHEEIFLEFSSSERREACVRVLEERMEAVRVSSSDKGADTDLGNLESRIMEDLDESAPLEPRSPPPVDPSPMFGSTSSTFLEFKPEPMRVTCLTIGSRGDVQPYIALCKGLQAEGHRTKIASHGEYKDWVEGHGIEFASVGGDPAELMQMCVDNGMFTISFMKEGLGKFRGWLDDLLNSSWEACQDSDLLIESPSAMGGVHIAEALQIPYFRAFTMPWTRTRAYPHAFAVPEHKKGGAYNYMTYTMFDQVFWRAIAGQVNRWRRKVMNIEATTFDKLEQHKIPFLYNFSPSVVPPPLDWTEWIHVTGYWFLENADESAAKESSKEFTPPDGLLEFIDEAKRKGKKVVYIGFGSIVVSDPEEMTRCVVDAVVDADVYAILSKGWSDRGSKGDDGDVNDDEKEVKEDSDDKDGADGVKYPKQIFSIDSIDHSWLFTRIDAACHHGGAGTTGASLRAGIPTIIKPFFGDQAFWSERVESLNVGSAVRKLSVEALSDALKKATTDEKQIAKAKVVGEMIRRENGVVRAIEAIYRDLEYAKSQIKPLPTPADHSIPLHKMSSILSKDSISLSGLSLTMSGSVKPKDKSSSRPSSFYAAEKSNSDAVSSKAPTSAHAQSDVPPPKGQPESRDQSTERYNPKEQGSDGSWSVVSQEGRSRAGSASYSVEGDGGRVAVGPELGPAI